MEPTILHIETATDVCSVALTQGTEVLGVKESADGNSHSKNLLPFIDQVLREGKMSTSDLHGIAVSIGPGSYTGLRIGVSTAKGIAYSLGIPVITVSTLESIAQGAKHQTRNDHCDIVPMIDARRMEVYTAVYDNSLEAIVEPQPMILDKDSFSSLLDTHHLVMMGNGAQKAQDVIKHRNVKFMPGINPVAVEMMALSEKAFREKRFIDVAYSTPLYLKDFQATVPKKRFE